MEFKDTKDRTAEEQEELFQALILHVQEGEPLKFEFIKNTAEWQIIQASRTGLVKVVKLFETVATSLHKAYCMQVKEGIGNFDMLCAYHRYLACKDFYLKELDTAKDMIKEYWAYLKSGHFIEQFFLAKQRSETDLYDFRKNVK